MPLCAPPPAQGPCYLTNPRACGYHPRNLSCCSFASSCPRSHATHTDHHRAAASPRIPGGNLRLVRSPATFTGASLDALIADALANHSTLNVPDPDVDRFAITVEARMPAHDVGTPGVLPDMTDGLLIGWSIALRFRSTPPSRIRILASPSISTMKIFTRSLIWRRSRPQEPPSPFPPLATSASACKPSVNRGSTTMPTPYRQRV